MYVRDISWNIQLVQCPKIQSNLRLRIRAACSGNVHFSGRLSLPYSRYSSQRKKEVVKAGTTLTEPYFSECKNQHFSHGKYYQAMLLSCFKNQFDHSVVNGIENHSSIEIE